MNKIKTLCIVHCALCIAICASAQNWNSILPEIEQNNKSLQALRQEVEAEKAANHVGIAPANPEVEFSYLWGHGAEEGDRMDLSVSQSLPLSTILGYQSRLAKQQDLRANLRLKVERTAVLLQAQQTCIDIVYTNAMLHEYGKRLAHAQTLADAIGADLFEIAPKVPYTRADLNWMDKQSRSTIEMQNPASRPEIASSCANIANQPPPQRGLVFCLRLISAS